MSVALLENLFYNGIITKQEGCRLGGGVFGVPMFQSVSRLNYNYRELPSLPICLGKVKLSQMLQVFSYAVAESYIWKGEGGRVIYCKSQRVRVEIGPYGHAFQGC